jgi:putative SOS response-associated peptidase YedK
MRATVHRPGQLDTVTIWENGEFRQVELPWGLRPIEPNGKPVSLLRWEGREIENPCLIMLHDFGLRMDGRDKYRVRLSSGGPFCVAGVWRPAGKDWPAAYAVLTTEAYPDVEPYKDRHMAVVRQEDWLAWLRSERPAADLLRPFPEGSFQVTGPTARQRTPEPAERDLFDRG